ncbi:MAG: HAD-IIIC family phosphatase [Paludibacter sp.]|jgi:FkbH-like protein|nr:HAD-IIIC family phosphatase [Paludibacter sp.]
MDKINFKDIKLIIWDLDDTFWNGTITEGGIVPIEKNIGLISDLTDCGIINSICSKNTFEDCANKLKELKIFDFFVFPSINWDNKGKRIAEQIQTMSLRPANVLFIDDNNVNLQEAKYYSADLQIALPEVIDELISYVKSIEKTDKQHKRLLQYKLLEEKNIEKSKFDNNDEFLFASNIQVEIKNDCLTELGRIHELIIRTNQLNFTKNRISIEELTKLLTESNVQCGYITVRDRFGDYGIVGFYALRDNYLEHFVFSCRTMGQGVEQYVYARLNFPDIEIVGEVQANLEKTTLPAWINQQQANIVSEIEEQNVAAQACKILLKGPCDLSKTSTYIKGNDLFACEFTYVNEKTHNIIEGYNHSVHILGLKEYSATEKQEIVEDCIFVDAAMLEGSFFYEKYDIVFLSALIESGYGIYRKKGTDIRVAFGDYKFPLTDKNNWQDYISGKLYNGNNKFTKSYLETFAQKYEFVGRTSPDEYVSILKKMLAYLPFDTVICLILGAEYHYPKSDDISLHHSLLNQKVRELAITESRIKYIDVAKIAIKQSDFTDSINHFSTRIYYEMAQKMTDVINSVSPDTVRQYAKWMVYTDKIIIGVRAVLKKILKNPDNRAYKWIKNVYSVLRRKKK